MALDQDNLVRVLLRERAKLTSYIWSICHEPHLTDDVFQEVCLEAIHHREQIRDEAHLLAWARRTARHRAINLLKQLSRSPLMLSDGVMDLLESTWQEQDADASDTTAAALHRCLDELAPRARSMVRLRYIEGLKVKTVARMMGQKADAVYKTMSRIHRQLIECIRQRRDEAAAASEVSDG